TTGPSPQAMGSSLGCNEQARCEWKPKLRRSTMDAIEHTIWYKLRYTPVRDVLRGRISGRMDVRRPIENSGLPPLVKELLYRVVRKTGLWRLEQVQVAQELIAHFTDGIAAGQKPEELIKNFGDEKQAAQLIRRAKRRNRPPIWQLARITGWSMAALLLL